MATKPEQKRAARADALLERAAQQSDRNTRPGREQAARLITQANAVARGQPIPAHAKLERKR